MTSSSNLGPVRAKGRTASGPEPINLVVTIVNGRVSIKDANHLPFWLEFNLPVAIDVTARTEGGRWIQDVGDRLPQQFSPSIDMIIIPGCDMIMTKSSLQSVFYDKEKLTAAITDHDDNETTVEGVEFPDGITTAKALKIIQDEMRGTRGGGGGGGWEEVVNHLNRLDRLKKEHPLPKKQDESKDPKEGKKNWSPSALSRYKIELDQVFNNLYYNGLYTDDKVRPTTTLDNWVVWDGKFPICFACKKDALDYWKKIAVLECSQCHQKVREFTESELCLECVLNRDQGRFLHSSVNPSLPEVKGDDKDPKTILAKIRESASKASDDLKSDYALIEKVWEEKLARDQDKKASEEDCDHVKWKLCHLGSCSDCERFVSKKTPEVKEWIEKVDKVLGGPPEDYTWLSNAPKDVVCNLVSGGHADRLPESLQLLYIGGIYTDNKIRRIPIGGAWQVNGGQNTPSFTSLESALDYWTKIAIHECKCHNKMEYYTAFDDKKVGLCLECVQKEKATKAKELMAKAHEQTREQIKGMNDFHAQAQIDGQIKIDQA